MISSNYDYKYLISSQHQFLGLLNVPRRCHANVRHFVLVLHSFFVSCVFLFGSAKRQVGNWGPMRPALWSDLLAISKADHSGEGDLHEEHHSRTPSAVYQGWVSEDSFQGSDRGRVESWVHQLSKRHHRAWGEGWANHGGYTVTVSEIAPMLFKTVVGICVDRQYARLPEANGIYHCSASVDHL